MVLLPALFARPSFDVALASDAIVAFLQHHSENLLLEGKSAAVTSRAPFFRR